MIHFYNSSRAFHAWIPIEQSRPGSRVVLEDPRDNVAREWLVTEADDLVCVGLPAQFPQLRYEPVE